MRAVIAFLALALPLFVTAQVVCDSGDALCCFDSADVQAFSHFILQILNGLIIIYRPQMTILRS